jgi:uncharacterized protein
MDEPFVARLPKGDDLLEAVTRVFRDRSISKAAFNVIGAVDRAVVGFYDTKARQYRNTAFDEALEIVACMGNVSIKDGEIFVHAHITLSTQDCRCVGGHLMPETPIFAAELFAHPLAGEPKVRVMDDPTGLALWSEP